MVLVSYGSDSESDTEAGPAPPPPPPPVSSKPKSSVSSSLSLPAPKRRKLVSDKDSSGPRKIIVDLPKLSSEDGGDNESTTRKAGIGKAKGSSVLGFLPAPKRTGAAAAAAAKDEPKPKDEPKKERVLGGAAKNLEYAAAPMSVSMEDADDEDAPKSVATTSTTTSTSTNTEPKASAPAIAGLKPRTIQPFFRKTTTKKPSIMNAIAPQQTTNGTKKENVSLFSFEGPTRQIFTETTTSEYKPIMLPEDEEEAPTETSLYAQQESIPVDQPDTLESIGQTMGLSKSDMRMLQGRRGRNMPVNIAEFNVQEQYDANEKARQSGELAPEAKPVRSIMPGKHQLSSLLSAAQTQKNSYEEQFAQGKKNKKDSGAKYGW